MHSGASAASWTEWYPPRKHTRCLELGSDVGEIQLSYGSNWDAPSTRHFKTTHSTYDS